MNQSPWLRRLKYYGIGFGMGLIFVFFFFQNRGCSWLPENRVKNSILDRVVVISEETGKQLEAQGLDGDFIIDILNDGDVVFAESDKSGESKVYKLEKDGKSVCFTLPYESFLAEAFLSKDAFKVKMSKEGMGDILRFPNDPALIYPDTTARLTCQQSKLGFINPKQILSSLKKSGKVNFTKTNLAVRPKPEHYLTLMKDQDTIGLKVIWYKNKLNVLSFDVPFDTGCDSTNQTNLVDN